MSPQDSTDDTTRGPVGRAIDLFVYAPIGLFFEGPRLVPKLVEQGKGHVRTARVFGEFAVRQGQGELRRRLGALEEQASDLLQTFGLSPNGHEVPVSPPPAPPDRTASQGGPARAEAEPTPGERAAAVVASPPADQLAISDYDSLSASQVVNRLGGLSDEELEALRTYEIAHRGRKTILNKVAQLQA